MKQKCLLARVFLRTLYHKKSILSNCLNRINKFREKNFENNNVMDGSEYDLPLMRCGWKVQPTQVRNSFGIGVRKYYTHSKTKSTAKAMLSIKQVLPTEKQKEYGRFVRTPFYISCSARYSVLHLLDVLPGGNKPPLCKGRWHGLP